MNAGFPGRRWQGDLRGWGQGLDPALQPAQYTDDFFVYVANPANMATLTTAQVNINVQADSDFEWIESTVSANLHGQAEPNPDTSIIPITLQIVDTGSGRQLFQAPLPITMIAGTGKQPFILPVPRIFMSKTTINLTFTSFSANTWDNIFFSMIGRKIFKLG